jgi:uncharacterized damage-inducible protein DinB
MLFTVAGIKNFHDWTHATLSILLKHLEGLPTAEYTKTMEGFGLLSIRNQVVHMLECETRWVSRAQGRAFSYFDPAMYPAVADARDLQQKVVRETLAYLRSINEEQLNQEIALHLPEGESISRTPGGLLHHVLTHAFHHKGQIVAMCRTLGHSAPNTDLVWVIS